jgi:hypothetical protein
VDLSFFTRRLALSQRPEALASRRIFPGGDAALHHERHGETIDFATAQSAGTARFYFRRSGWPGPFARNKGKWQKMENSSLITHLASSLNLTLRKPYPQIIKTITLPLTILTMADYTTGYSCVSKHHVGSTSEQTNRLTLTLGSWLPPSCGSRPTAAQHQTFKVTEARVVLLGSHTALVCLAILCLVSVRQFILDKEGW